MRDLTMGVLTKVFECIKELVSQGAPVKIDGFGIFYPTISSEGADSPLGYDINAYIKGVHLRFKPDSTNLDNITSPQFRKRCSMSLGQLINQQGEPCIIQEGEVVPLRPSQG